MKRRRPIRVLIVEDDANWREALCLFYEEMFSSSSVTIECVSSGPDALRRLRAEKFNLLSLDINLGLAHPRTDRGSPDGAILGADGRTVLRTAYDENACNAVIVITGLHCDETLKLVIPDDAERRVVKMTLASYLQKLFPGRNLYLQKEPEISIPECIKVYKNSLSYDQLVLLCEALPGIPPPYTIEVFGEFGKAKILIRSKSSPLRIVSIKRSKDAEFLYSLAYMRKAVNPVTKEMVCGIYRGRQAKELVKSDLARCADIDVNSFRRRLRKLGVSPDELFVTERETGWSLHPNVNIRGLATVDLRSPGFGGSHRGRDLLQDVADPSYDPDSSKDNSNS